MLNKFSLIIAVCFKAILWPFLFDYFVDFHLYGFVVDNGSAFFL